MGHVQAPYACENEEALEANQDHGPADLDLSHIVFLFYRNTNMWFVFKCVLLDSLALLFFVFYKMCFYVCFKHIMFKHV